MVGKLQRLLLCSVICNQPYRSTGKLNEAGRIYAIAIKAYIKPRVEFVMVLRELRQVIAKLIVLLTFI